MQQGKIPPAGHAMPVCVLEHALEVQPVALCAQSALRDFPFHSTPGVAAAGWDVAELGLGCSDIQGCALRMLRTKLSAPCCGLGSPI